MVKKEKKRQEMYADRVSTNNKWLKIYGMQGHAILKGQEEFDHFVRNFKYDYEDYPALYRDASFHAIVQAIEWDPSLATKLGKLERYFDWYPKKNERHRTKHVIYLQKN